jgi:hypothetical protein
MLRLAKEYGYEKTLHKITTGFMSGLLLTLPILNVTIAELLSKGKTKAMSAES